jgi:hypothetical protein
MATDNDEPNLDDVMVPTEVAHPDHRAHAKTDKHVDDAQLERRTEHERQLVEDDRNRRE